MLTYEQAIELLETNWWERATAREIAEFCLHEERLCCPMEVVYKAFREAMGRPVYTHEFVESNIPSLRAEFYGETPPKTLQEVIDMIPEAKRIIVAT